MLTGKPSLAALIAHYCTGQGIEIGAGKNPYGPRGRTVFLDKHVDNKDGMANPDIVADGTNVPVADGTYDFLISAHCLEHCQNTIRTLNEWTRLLKPGGTMFLVLPHADRTFDRHRAKTSLAHHVEDFETLGDEWDRSHIEEITAGWSIDMTPEDQVAYRQEWGADVWDWDFRFANDVIHFHVWTQDEIVRLLQYLGLKIAFVDEFVADRADSFVVVARKAA
jgi:SAM-dependent methyltransferase